MKRQVSAVGPSTSSHLVGGNFRFGSRLRENAFASGCGDGRRFELLNFEVTMGWDALSRLFRTLSWLRLAAGRPKWRSSSSGIGEDVKPHFRSHLFDRLGQKLGRSHPRFDGPERMFDDLTADRGLSGARSRRSCIASMMASCFNALCGAALLGEQLAHSRRPVAVQVHLILDRRIARGQSFSGRHRYVPFSGRR